MSNWKKVKLNNICDFKYGSGLPARNRIKGDFPVYGSGGVIDSHNSFLNTGPGIIVGRKGSIGTVYYSIDNYWPIDTVFYIEKKENIDFKYLYYLLLNMDLGGLNSDAAVPGLNKDTALMQEVLIKDIEVDQQKIASILSAYDDLIEVNNKRIKILEEMAQLIYKDWFVNFKFPGYENVKIQNGVPEGWEVKNLEEVTEIISRGPSLKYVKKGGIPVLNQRCVRGGEIELQAIQYAEELNDKKIFCYLHKNDILINSMGVGTLGRISRNLSIKDKMIIHNCITFVRARRELMSRALLYYIIKDHEKEYELLGVGATGQTSLQKSTVQKTEVLVPPMELQIKFDKNVLSMWELIGKLKNINNNLRETRDLLLPRLMSGEFEIK